MTKLGITVGKFMPLHKGHELMILFASKMLDKLYVVVSGNETDAIPLSMRYEWVRKYAMNGGLTNVYVVKHTDKSPEPIEVDENGTVLDEEFQSYWVGEFKKILPFTTHFVSSDMYGKTIADRMGIEWLMVDPKREMIGVSGTKIRSNIIQNFAYISDIVKPDLVKTVAIVGPESTGKSTLTATLSDIFSDISISEYGRNLSEIKKNNLTEEDFYLIAESQEKMIETAKQITREPIIFTDTEAFTTYLFGEIYIDKKLDAIYNMALKQNFDHYLVLYPNVFWVDDGTRVLGDQEKRIEFYKRIVEFLDTNGKSYTVIDDKFYSERMHSAIKVVEGMLCS